VKVQFRDWEEGEDQAKFPRVQIWRHTIYFAGYKEEQTVAAKIVTAIH
jgi:hypothetical protein